MAPLERRPVNIAQLRRMLVRRHRRPRIIAAMACALAVTAALTLTFLSYSNDLEQNMAAQQRDNDSLRTQLAARMHETQMAHRRLDSVQNVLASQNVKVDLFAQALTRGKTLIITTITNSTEARHLDTLTNFKYYNPAVFNYEYAAQSVSEVIDTYVDNNATNLTDTQRDDLRVQLYGLASKHLEQLNKRLITLKSNETSAMPRH